MLTASDTDKTVDKVSARYKDNFELNRWENSRIVFLFDKMNDEDLQNRPWVNTHTREPLYDKGSLILTQGGVIWHASGPMNKKLVQHFTALQGVLLHQPTSHHTAASNSCGKESTEAHTVYNNHHDDHPR